MVICLLELQLEVFQANAGLQILKQLLVGFGKEGNFILLEKLLVMLSVFITELDENVLVFDKVDTEFKHLRVKVDVGTEVFRFL